MAEYVFEELEQFHFDVPEFEQLYQQYKTQYEAGLEPSAKTWLYHPDEQIRQIVVNITMTPHELSQKWDEVMEGMNIVNRDVSAQDVQLSIHYFKLRKLKKMLEENQRDMETATGDALMSLIMIHKQLKEFEQQITSQLGTVILK